MGNSIIKHVTINKLWGIKTISVDFDKHVNIFIGMNGSGKTTFLQLIEATLLVDLKVFLSIEFEFIKIDFINSDIQYVCVRKEEKRGECFINYYFGEAESICIPCSEMMIQHPYKLSWRYSDLLSIVKEKMKNLVNISWLSVNRCDSDFEEYGRRDFEKFNSLVDIKLDNLVEKLLVYQLQLESEVNKDSLKFKEEVLSLMLYNSSFDNLTEQDLEIFESTDTDSMKRDLYKAFNKLGVAKDKYELVQNHINKIKESISNLATLSSESSSQISLEDILVLSLINRTMSIIKISKEHEVNAANIFAPLTKFLRCLKDFMPDKTYKLNSNGRGELIIELSGEKNKEKGINIKSLSSGEKQLFILLTESLLQKNTNHIFIADEPELSLHIGWQRIIIEKILEMNPNAQIIVATHSPEIAGRFPKNIVNMNSITCYE